MLADKWKFSLLPLVYLLLGYDYYLKTTNNSKNLTKNTAYYLCIAAVKLILTKYMDLIHWNRWRNPEIRIVSKALKKVTFITNAWCRDVIFCILQTFLNFSVISMKYVTASGLDLIFVYLGKVGGNNLWLIEGSKPSMCSLFAEK